MPNIPCGFSYLQVLTIIVVDRYLDYFTTIMEDRLWQVLAKPVFRWQWERAVKENIDFSASRVNGTNYDFGADLDYFNMTDAKADQISFIGRRYEFFEQAVGLRDFLSQNTYHT